MEGLEPDQERWSKLRWLESKLRALVCGEAVRLVTKVEDVVTAQSR